MSKPDVEAIKQMLASVNAFWKQQSEQVTIPLSHEVCEELANGHAAALGAIVALENELETTHVKYADEMHMMYHDAYIRGVDDGYNVGYHARDYVDAYGP